MPDPWFLRTHVIFMVCAALGILIVLWVNNAPLLVDPNADYCGFPAYVAKVDEPDRPENCR